MFGLLIDAEPLSQVVFIHDYIQLVFQQVRLSIYNEFSIQKNGKILSFGESGFCDSLVALIDQRVEDVQFVEGVEAVFSFTSGQAVRVPLTGVGCRGPEALMLSDDQGLCVVEQNA